MDEKKVTPASQKSVWLAVLCMSIGTAVIAVAAGLISVSPENFNAPRSIVGLAGFVFFVAGTSLLMPANSAWRAGMAAIILIAMASIGYWVALVADPADISGGLPFLDKTDNAQLGKWVFGVGALITSGMAGYAVKDFWKKLSLKRR